MQRSKPLRDATLAFYDHFSTNDLASFDDLVSEKAMLYIGTADHEWFTDRVKLRSGFGWEGFRLEGGDPQAWEDGAIGWVADRPTMHVPGIGPIRTRFTGIFRHEAKRWKLLVSHFSVGVPDEEVVELQRRWLGEPPSP
jgi:hypothetical protein